MPSFWTKRVELPWLTPLIAYCIGILAIIWGAVGLGRDNEMAAASTVKVAEYVFHVMGIIWGVLICVATWIRYRGGLWFAVGTFLVGGAFVGTASIVETHIRGWHFDSPVAFYTRIAACWVVGVAFLVTGHRRHCRKQQAQPPMAQELKKLKIVALIGIVFLGVLAFTPLLGHEWIRSHPAVYPSVVPAGQWKRFTSDEGRFSIRFPGRPEMTNVVINVSTNYSITQPCFFVWADRQTEYAVNYADYPKALQINIERLGPQKQFDLSQAAVAAAYGKIVSQRDIKFGDFPGREFEFVAGGKANFSGKVRLILVNHRLYQIIIIFLTRNPHPDDFKVFFSSFSIPKSGN